MLQWSAENSLLTAPHLLMMVDSISDKMSLPAISVNPPYSVQEIVIVLNENLEQLIGIPLMNTNQLF